VLRRMRQDAGLRLEDVYRLTGIHAPELSVLERHEKNPTLKTLRKLSKVYRVPVWEIVLDMETEREASEAFDSEKDTVAA
jgi:HTH-type transcriptional regulator, competence development regulator